MFCVPPTLTLPTPTLRCIPQCAQQKFAPFPRRQLDSHLMLWPINAPHSCMSPEQGQPIGYFLLWDYLTENPLISGMFFCQMPPSTIGAKNTVGLYTHFLAGWRQIIQAKRKTQQTQSFGNPFFLIILKFSHCLPSQQHPQPFENLIHMFLMYI